MSTPKHARRPLVSSIIVFWNAVDFLAEAVESVLAQTYPAWELLLVDDGSDDGGTAVAMEYARSSPMIRYLAHPDHERRGISASRNLGLRHARGDYIAFLDADDLWFPNTLEEQVAIMESRPEAAMTYGPIEWWFSWTGKAEDQGRDYVEALGVVPDAMVQPPRLLVLFVQDEAAVPSGMLVRRDVADGVGGFEDAFRGEYDDQVFVAKICLSNPVFVSGRCWYRYRRHEASTVAIGMRDGSTDAARIVFLSWLASYLRSQGVRTPALWSAVRLEMWRLTRPRTYHLIKRGERLARQLSTRLRGWT